jgi:hypothetical protein
MSFKSDVKPIVILNTQTSAIAFTGRTRLRAYSLQGVSTSGTVVINGLANATTVSTSTNTQVYLLGYVAAGQTSTLNLPEDGVLYSSNNAFGCVDGIGVVNNSGVIVTLFIDK